MCHLSVIRWLLTVGSLVGVLGFSGEVLSAETLRACVNQETKGTPTGTLGNFLMAQVSRQLPEIQIEYTLLPWARCLKQVERGDFDMVLTGSHSAERAKSMAFPVKADGNPDPSKRMFNLGFAVIRRTGTKVVWDGERFVGLEGQVGAQTGYSVVDFLRAKQVDVDPSSPHVANALLKLVAGRIGAVVVNPFAMTGELREPEFAGKLELLGEPLIQKKPYFLILSNPLVAARPELAARLWKAVEQARNSTEFGALYAKQVEIPQAEFRLKP